MNLKLKNPIGQLTQPWYNNYYALLLLLYFILLQNPLLTLMQGLDEEQDLLHLTMYTVVHGVMKTVSWTVLTMVME